MREFVPFSMVFIVQPPKNKTGIYERALQGKTTSFLVTVSTDMPPQNLIILPLHSIAQELTGFVSWGLYLSNLMVLPEHHQNGIGSTLLNYAMGHARDFGREALAFWTLRDNNAPAREFYEKRGFDPMTRDGEQVIVTSSYGKVAVAYSRDCTKSMTRVSEDS